MAHRERIFYLLSDVTRWFYPLLFTWNITPIVYHFLSVCLFFVGVCVWSFQGIATSMAMLASVDLVKEASSKPTRNLSICCRIKFGQRQTGTQLELTSPRHSFRISDEIRIHFMLFNWYYKLYRKYLLHSSFITALYITFGNN